MIHKGCGGTIREDYTKTYEYEGVPVPAYFCTKCGVEVTGDAMIEGLDEGTVDEGDVA